MTLMMMKKLQKWIKKLQEWMNLKMKMKLKKPRAMKKLKPTNTKAMKMQRTQSHVLLVQ